MSIKSDKWIQKMSQKHTNKLINPFSRKQITTGISYGLSSYGYDIRIGYKFLIPNTENYCVVSDIPYKDLYDPKNNNNDLFHEYEAIENCIIINPNSYIIGESIEYFKIPRNIITVCTGKSTYARAGVIVNVTPFEPEWEGKATIAIINCSPLSVRIHSNEGIAQLLFFEADELCRTSYKDKKGKYQKDNKIVLSK